MVELKPLLKTLTLYAVALILISVFVTLRIHWSMNSEANSPRGGFQENIKNIVNSKYYNMFDSYWKDEDNGWWLYTISGIDCAYYKILDSPWQWTEERRLLDMTMMRKWADSMIDLLFDMLSKLTFNIALLICKY